MGLALCLLGGGGGTGLCVWEEADGPISSGSNIPLTLTHSHMQSPRKE